MLYQPKKVGEMWDTWLYFHKGIHYLFYLHKTDPAFPLWDGMSVATSLDGVHYREVGPILHKAEDAEWLGTGSTVQVGDKFVLNYSECRNGVQAIFIAESADLINWQKSGDSYRCDPDPRWYDTSPSGRWDCIWTVPDGSGGWLGYLTATPLPSQLGLQCESVGKVVSKDGLHWTASTPPVFEWGDWPAMNLGELGAVEQIGEYYYMIVGNVENRFGSRHYWHQLGQQVGMYAFMADKPEGPYRPVKDNFRLLTSSHWATYFARFYRTPGAVLLNHHSIERNVPAPRVWMAPLKKVQFDNGRIKLAYWSGNECLKGKQIDLQLEGSQIIFPKNDDKAWKLVGSKVEGAAEHHGGLAILSTTFNLERGLVMEGSWQVTPSIPGWSSIGFFIEEEPSRSGSAVLIQTRGITQAGQLSLLPHGIVDFVADDGIEKGISAGQLTKVRLLFRRTMLELYMNDELILCYSLPNKPTGRIGLLFETGQAVFEKMKAWEMNIT